MRARWLFVWLAGCGARSELQAPVSSAGAGGAGGGGAGGAPPAVCAVGEPAVALAGGLTWPYGITLDTDWVYFSTYDGEKGGVFRVPKVGGATEALATGLDYPDQLVLVGEQLYVAEAGANRILRLPKGGGPVTAFATGQGGPTDIATDGQRLYWTNYLSDEVVEATLGGELTIVGASLDPFRIAVGPDRLYVAGLGPSLHWFAKGGGASGVVASPSPRDVAVAGERLLWTDGGLWWSDLDGGDVQAFGDLEDAAFFDGLAVDAHHAFVAVSAGRIWRFSLEGEAPVPLVDGQDLPAIVAVDDSCVYWTNTGSGPNGAVMRAGK